MASQITGGQWKIKARRWPT